jgi:uncharacterized membrane protein YfcA
MAIIHALLYVLLGVGVGACGTLIGAGGGFILVPLLLLLDPGASPDLVTATSLAVVFCNALSGSWAYARMGRIDYKYGMLFAAATIPGSISGALSVNLVPRRLFNGIFGGLLLVLAAYLLIRKPVGAGHQPADGASRMTRTVTERNGTVHTYTFNPKIGLWLSLGVGYLSSMLGIGGGIIHVPALVRLLNFPVHIATATSHFMLAIMALTGTVVHIASGSFSQGGAWRTIRIAAGVLAGAQAGAALSTRIHGHWIIRGLALALASVGLRILFAAL